MPALSRGDWAFFPLEKIFSHEVFDFAVSVTTELTARLALLLVLLAVMLVAVILLMLLVVFSHIALNFEESEGVGLLVVAVGFVFAVSGMGALIIGLGGVLVVLLLLGLGLGLGLGLLLLLLVFGGEAGRSIIPCSSGEVVEMERTNTLGFLGFSSIVSIRIRDPSVSR